MGVAGRVVWGAAAVAMASGMKKGPVRTSAPALLMVEDRDQTSPGLTATPVRRIPGRVSWRGGA